MASMFYEFSGTAKWARVKTPNKFDKYQINLYVDSETRKAIRGLGTRLNFREDDEGFYVTFRRDHSKKMGTKIVEFGPPEVVDADGNEFDEFIGNGSHVTVEVEVYDWEHPEHGKGKGTRLTKVIVDDLVPWKPEEEEVEPVVEVVSKPAPKRKASLSATPF